jgi:FKBP-type peptidyl-prolyl cis-trans isomerase 2
VNPLQEFPTEKAVQDGAKVTVRFQITPWDRPHHDLQRYRAVHPGPAHTIPLGIELRTAGKRPGEVTSLSLSAEEGFGPYDETKIQIVPPAEARKGDTIANRAGTTARIVRILPERALLDLNHPLAGKPLLVSLQIVTIENSDEEETLP